MTKNNQFPNRDERLAAFANQVLDGEANDLSIVESDPKTRPLAETILRLHHAFPKEGPDPASAKRIQAGVLARWRDEKQKKARWSNFLRPGWLAQFRRPQFAMAVAVVAVIGILIVVAPILFTSGSPITASAGSESALNIITWIVLGVLIAVGVWLLRRKS